MITFYIRGGHLSTYCRPVVHGNYVYVTDQTPEKTSLGKKTTFWAVTLDGQTQKTIIDSIKTLNPPVFYNEYIFYVDMETSCIFKGRSLSSTVATADTKPEKLVDRVCKSDTPPAIFNDYCYFRDKDNFLVKVNINKPASGKISKVTTFGDLIKVNSTPFPAPGFIVYQGVDNKLMRMNDCGGKTQIGDWESASPLFLKDDHLYFQGN